MGATLSPFSLYKYTTNFLIYQIFCTLFSLFLLIVEAESISQSNNGRAEQSRAEPLCSIVELFGDIMLNYGCRCLIFSELSGSKIELFDFWTILGILSGCLGMIMNITHAKPPLDAHRLQRVAGVTAENEPKRAGATLKNFF